MTEAEILNLINSGESTTVEFKKSTNEITKGFMIRYVRSRTEKVDIFFLV